MNGFKDSSQNSIIDMRLNVNIPTDDILTSAIKMFDYLLVLFAVKENRDDISFSIVETLEEAEQFVISSTKKAS